MLCSFKLTGQVLDSTSTSRPRATSAAATSGGGADIAIIVCEGPL